MSIYANVNGKKQISSIFANVNGAKKKIQSVWVNKDGAPAKVYSSVQLPFFVIATDYSVKITTDFITFKDVLTLSSTNDTYIQGLFYLNEMFFLVTTKYLYYSKDGKTWIDTELSLPTHTYNMYLNRIVFANGIYILAHDVSKSSSSSTTYYYRSTDGITWESIFDKSAREYVSLSVVDDKFTVTSESDNAILQSSDGLTWDTISCSESYIKKYCLSIVKFNNKYVAFTSQRTCAVLYSDDLITWTKASYSSIGTNYVMHGYYINNNKLYFNVGYNGRGIVQESSDGMTFTAVSTKTTVDSNNYTYIYYGDNITNMLKVESEYYCNITNFYGRYKTSDLINFVWQSLDIDFNIRRMKSKNYEDVYHYLLG